MLFNTRMILAYVIAALASVPALINADALDNDATASSDVTVPNPTCYRNAVAGSCNEYINDFCADVSGITFSPSDTVHHCYGGLSTKNTKYKCGFALQNTNSNQKAHPDENNCIAVMKKIDSYCSTHGGYGKYAPDAAFLFRITADTRNSGVCTNIK